MRRPVPNDAQVGVNLPGLPLEECYAKTKLSERGEVVLGATVEEHGLTVGHVAQRLVHVLSEQGGLQKLLPSGINFLASVHDVGKITPAFQEKIRRATKSYVPNSCAALRNVVPDLERQWDYHPGASFLTMAEEGRSYAAEIVGMHHGYMPQVGGKKIDDEIFGGPSWQVCRRELINRLKRAMRGDWPEVSSEEQSLFLAGLITVADWIGSSDRFADGFCQRQVQEAVEQAGFVVPVVRQGLSFSDVFGTSYKPTPLQEAFYQVVDTAGIYILEAPMGSGKTEAALYAAYRLLEKGEARGIYFALPTQITSEKIWSRVNAFLDQVLDERSPMRRACLLHGDAWLTATDLGLEGEPGGEWFSSLKRAILAPFGVGTIDQALMAVMNIRHASVRAFGLAGKVVILDEVHSYDAYTGCILAELIASLSRLGCTVILLSATLRDQQRRELLSALPGLERSQLEGGSSYPLVTAWAAGRTAKVVTPIFKESRRVEVRMISDDAAYEEACRRAAGRQQVLWVENTVAEAQRTFGILSARSEGRFDVGLLHSRYTKADRQKKEEKWVSLFGREGWNQRTERGRILVGTQVLEQSLDIDADFLVTRLCPTDMLLQRIGRLWRHDMNDSRRPRGARREVWILPASDDGHGPRPFGRSGHVYAPYVLYRAAELWANIQWVDLPGDVRGLLEATYADREESGEAAEWKAQLEESKARLKRQALLGVSRGLKTLSDETMPTRYSVVPECDVLILSHIEAIGDEVFLRLWNGEELRMPYGGRTGFRRREKDKVLALARNMVRVPLSDAPPAPCFDDLKWLRGLVYIPSVPSEKGEEAYPSWLIPVVVGKDGLLEGLFGGEGGEGKRRHRRLKYSWEFGYQVVVED